MPPPAVSTVHGVVFAKMSLGSSAHDVSARHGRACPGHPRSSCGTKNVDARDEPGHDGGASGEAVNPFDSAPILIRLRAVPNFKELALETSLVRQPKTPSSAIKDRSRDMLRERNRTLGGVTDSAAIRSRVVPKLKSMREKRRKVRQLRGVWRALPHFPLSCPGLTGASSTPPSLGLSCAASGILDRPVPAPPRLRRATEGCSAAEASAKAASRAMTAVCAAIASRRRPKQH